jgi:hypothetical protein
MTAWARAGATLLAALTAWTAAARPVSGQAGVPSPPQVTLVFDERGALDPVSVQARASLASMVADSTDVFVLSHGWRNDAASADCRYQQQIKGISAALPPTARPIFVLIVWPSAMFPLVQDACGGMPRRPFFVDQQGRATATDVRAWAQAAFPAAARTRRFGGDVEQLTALLNAGGPPQEARARLREAASILVGWRDAGSAGLARVRAIDGPGDRALAGTADEVVAAYESIQRAQPGRSPWSIVPSIAEVFSFWTMKARAGVIGSTGVHEVLKGLSATLPSTASLHLVGHSFGGKLLTAAVVGGPGVEPAAVGSLTILQGAFSHLAFSTAEQIRALDIPTETGGAYAAVLERKLAAVLAVTYSAQDHENQRWYPLGTMLSQDAFEKGAPRYAALGARGMEGPASVLVTLREESLAARSSPTRPRIFNVDASGVILGHSDVAQPRVYRIIADVAAIANRARAESARK